MNPASPRATMGGLLMGTGKAMGTCEGCEWDPATVVVACRCGFRHDLCAECAEPIYLYELIACSSCDKNSRGRAGSAQSWIAPLGAVVRNEG
jgi:hypothetical protein